MAHPEYRKIKTLGVGGQAEVYLGETDNGSRHAVKFLPRPTLGARNRLMREGLLQQSGIHGIVPVYEMFSGSSTVPPYLLLEYMGGGCLKKKIERGKQPAKEVLGLARRLGLILAATHHQKIIHRDVKPANIFLSREGEAYLGDFGIAITDDEVPKEPSNLDMGGFVVTISYASPEQIEAQAIGPSHDVWGFGATLYEAVTGHLCEPGMRAGLLRSSYLLQREIDPRELIHGDEEPTGAHVALAHIINSCLQREDKRPRDGIELLDLL